MPCVMRGVPLSPDANQRPGFLGSPPLVDTYPARAVAAPTRPYQVRCRRRGTFVPYVEHQTLSDDRLQQLYLLSRSFPW
jgi:hypothetical protein